MNWWGMLFLLICIVIAGAMIMGRFGITLKWPDRKPSEKLEVKVVHAPAATPKHGDHPHEEHHDKDPWWKTTLILLGVLVVFLLILKYLVVPLFASWGFGQIPGASPAARYELSRTHGTAPTRVIPSDALSCPGDHATPIVIEPEQSILIVIPVNTLIDFQPNTADRTITACDYHQPHFCSSTTSLLDVGTSVLTIKNITKQQVPFTCHYVPR